MESNFKYEGAVFLSPHIRIEISVHKNNILILNVRPSGESMETKIYMYDPKNVRNFADMLNKAADAMDPKPAAQEDDANG